MPNPVITIRKLKGTRGWMIAQGIDWRVEAPTFEEVAREALHYGTMYESRSAVEDAIARYPWSKRQ